MMELIKSISNSWNYKVWCSLCAYRRLKTINGDEINRSEKHLKTTKSDVLHFYTAFQTFINSFARTFKRKSLVFFEIFRISLKSGHFPKSSKYAPKEQRWGYSLYIYIFSILTYT